MITLMTPLPSSDLPERVVLNAFSASVKEYLESSVSLYRILGQDLLTDG